MSDKLSDEQIERAFDSFKCTHPGAAPWYDVPERFLASTVRRLLAASPAPALSISDVPAKPLTRCAAARDGDCSHAQCPQLRNNEPHATGRHCPIDNWGDDD
ncbi:hypothetical protein [Burkholderia gladioli]|uniref:Uncharacterized protein n=1 Tax=Burkholderia gladioli TaxID=28095 RepID=A0AB38U5Q5_BURGA|nr:hypothetical protein [Burkholderia gladioli]UWX75329.1 hypothetical protein NYZ96_35190 [Burkholderia gladioli]